jgi:hypothetical protein
MACPNSPNRKHNFIKDHSYAKEFCNWCGRSRADIEFRGFNVPLEDDPSYGRRKR